MIFIGIDVAKDKHDMHAMTDDGEILIENMSFQNSKKGFEDFIDNVSGFTDGDFSKTKVGLESTGHYSLNLLSFLKTKGFEVVEFNPLTVNQFRKASTLRRTKTDKNDARYIAELLITNRSSTYQLLGYNISVLKSISRARFNLIKEIQPLKNRYRKAIHVLFPELDKVFCNLYINTVYQLLRKLPSAQDIANCNIARLAKLLSKFSHGKLSTSRAETLKETAKNSIGTYNYGDSFELKQMVERLIFLDTQKAQLENKIDAIMKELKSPIVTIPGIGNVLGAAILSEIGDINNFSSPSKLLAFAGAEPSTYQSGKFTATNTPMVKHGSKFLRNALYQATTSAYSKSPVFTKYIDLKRSQGKHYYVAISHGMKKMTRIIFAILKANTPFKEII